MTNKGVKPQISKAEKERLERIEQAKVAKVEEKKKKKAMIITTVSVIAAVLTVIIVLAAVLPGVLSPKDITGTYENEGQTLILRTDNTFSATLADNNSKSGTYKVDGRTISFVVDGETGKGTITGKSITVPTDWDDGHGHTTGAFKKK